MSPSTSTLPYVLKKGSYLSVVVNGRPFQLTSAHPSFDKIATALTEGKFAQVPKLIMTAENLANRTAGKITFKKGVVYYKGEEVNSTLAEHISKIADSGEDVAKYVLFMDNLYQNPSKPAISELFDFIRTGLKQNQLPPITDDGCFLAYKAVNANYTDCHTGTIDNSPGQKVEMERAAVDSDRHRTCSDGLHACLLSYLGSFTGSRYMEVKINPRDVVSIPSDYNFAKLRCCMYEVIRELTSEDMDTEYIKKFGHPLMQQTVVNITEDRQELIQLILDHPTMKRNIRKGQIAKTTIVKQTYGRLVKMYTKLGPIPTGVSPVDCSLFGNNLKAAREAAGLSLADMAMALDISKKTAYSTERRPNVSQATKDMWLKAIQELTKTTRSKAVSYPKPVTKRVTYGSAVGAFDTINSPMYASSGATATAVADDDDDEEEEYD